MPAPGRVARLDLPSGTGVRVDCAVGLDNEIPAEFDPLLAKVITHAATRNAALSRMICALSEFRLVIAGGATNKGVLLDLLDSDDFRRGGVDVDWLNRRSTTEVVPRYAAEALMVAAILTYLEERVSARLNFFAEAATGLPGAVPPSVGQTLDFTVRGQSCRVDVLALGEWRYRVQLDARQCVATLLDQETHACQLVVGEERFDITYAANDSSLRIEVNGHPHVIGRSTGGQVRASAPSVLIAVEVAVGDTVTAGQRLGLLETMKIEIAFAAPISGTVKEICVRRNQRVAAGDVLLVIEAGGEQSARATPREPIRLPPWSDPLGAWFDAAGDPQAAAVLRSEVPARQRAFAALVSEIRRVLLGYDVHAEEAERLLRLLHADLPPEPDARFLEGLAQTRHAVTVFADTEILFSRAPEEFADGTLGPSNDARLRMYVRRIGIRGAGIAESFLVRLQHAISHYGLPDLTPGEALERALLRLYAAKNNAETRYRLVQAVLRLALRVADAGVDLTQDQEFFAALTTCSVLRRQLSDTLADAAAEARYAIFELPHIRARAAAAAAAVEAALQTISEPDLPGIDNETLGRIADSPAQIFDRISQWTAEGDQTRRDVALQALVLRRYAPLVPLARHVMRVRDLHVSRLQLPDRRIVLAAVTPPEKLVQAWHGVSRAAARETSAPFVELMLTAPEQTSADLLRDRLKPLLGQQSLHARRLCVTALQPQGTRVHVVFERAEDSSDLVERTDLFGLHPETARRIELERLANFELERLPAQESVYVFFGRSRGIPDDERIFILAEARAAAPGPRGGLHEAAFVRVFYEAIHTLRNIRAERDQRRRLNWNRITIFVRPAMILLSETVQRMGRELTPAMRHLGLERIVVRVLLRELDDPSPPEARELVLEAAAGDRVTFSWRNPHHDPLRPASREERRIAEARRRGLTHPSEVIRLFTAGDETPAARLRIGTFDEFDLSPGSPCPLALSVGSRPPGENRSGIVFGLVSTPTAKHPEGMQRVLIVSDPIADMGALADAECDRIVAAIDLAEQRQLPVEWVAISSGARIAMDSGTENLDATARVVRRIVTFTAADGEINVIVPGINVGAQSYFDALATMLMHTRGILIMTPGASMVLTGRRALEASGGVAAEDEIGIGGFERIMGPSGQAQYYARDLSEAYRILLEHYRYCYVAPGEAGPRRHATTDPADRVFTLSAYPAGLAEGFRTVGEIFDDVTNPGRKRPFAMRPVMQALIDQDGSWLERWQRMAGAETAIVWDAHIGGFPVCLIGIESRPVARLGYRPNDGPDQWTGATLFPLSSKKVARALNAASGNRPAVILANLSGFDGSPESMRKLQLEYGAEIARAVVNFHGPVLFIVLSRYHGGAYVVFSRALNPAITAFAFEGSYASVIGGGPAATVVFAREVQARADGDQRVITGRERLAAAHHPAQAASLREELDRVLAEVTSEKHGEIASEFDTIHSVERARDVGSLDAIIAPSRLRAVAIEHLEAAYAATTALAAR